MNKTLSISSRDLANIIDEYLLRIKREEFIGGLIEVRAQGLTVHARINDKKQSE